MTVSPTENDERRPVRYVAGMASWRRKKHFVREWREWRGMSQEELAEEVNELLGGKLNKSNISKLENLKSGYTQDLLEAIAEVLAVHHSVLLTRPPNASDGPPMGAKKRA